MGAVWRHDQRHGYGAQISSGEVYRGQWRHDRRHGYGTLSCSGETYRGQRRHGQRDGSGVQTWKDGCEYGGRFKEGMYRGHGRTEWSREGGRVTHEGQYVDNARDGQGKYTWPDGRTYDGGWKKGQREGEGVETDVEGRTVRGMWEKNKVVFFHVSPEDNEADRAAPVGPGRAERGSGKATCIVSVRCQGQRLTKLCVRMTADFGKIMSRWGDKHGLDAASFQLYF